MRQTLRIRQEYGRSTQGHRLAQHGATKMQRSGQSSSQSGSSESNSGPPNANRVQQTLSVEAGSGEDDLQTTIISYLEGLDQTAPGSLRRSGAINHLNDAHQTLLHMAAVMGFNRLVRQLVIIGAHLDLQDVNGYTALALASLCGQITCARQLIEAGAAYDRPTVLGEMPLDLAKAGDHGDVEALLLSAVWSTEPEVSVSGSSKGAVDTTNEIDDDNPSSASDEEHSRVTRPRQRWKSRDKQRAFIRSNTVSPRCSRRSSQHTIPQLPSSGTSMPADDPPPYDEPVDTSSWMSWTLANIPHPHGLPHPQLRLPFAVLDRLPTASTFGLDRMVGSDDLSPKWIAFPAPSWEKLQKFTRPEEFKLFTQAMAAAAMNAVVRSGATTSASPIPTSQMRPTTGERSGRSRKRHKFNKRVGSRSSSGSPAARIIRHVKRESAAPDSLNRCLEPY